MQSFVTVQPGEVTSCVGCHEQRTKTPLPAERLEALTKPPSRIAPIADVPDVMDFPRDIQPILDAHCTSCHGYEKTHAGGPHDGGVILTGDRGPMYSHSYFTLSALRQVADGRNLPKSNYPPRGIGSSASPLMAKLSPEHYDVQPTALEHRTVRLWIDSAAPYPGTYAALGTGMIGGYAENRIDRSDTRVASMKEAMAVAARRCAPCHKGKLRLPQSPSDNMGMPPWAINYGDPRLRFSRHIIYNLTRPEKSLLLLAPLAANAGGYGTCRKAGAPEDDKSGVFATTDDADYAKLLAAIRDVKARLDTIGRFDMPDFRPRPEYIREMKGYGVLPADIGPDDPVDPYATDRAYWKSLWYQPAAPTTTAAALPVDNGR